MQHPALTHREAGHVRLNDQQQAALIISSITVFRTLLRFYHLLRHHNPSPYPVIHQYTVWRATGDAIGSRNGFHDEQAGLLRIVPTLSQVHQTMAWLQDASPFRQRRPSTFQQ